MNQDRFFRGLIRQGQGENDPRRLVVGKATRALAERMATTEAAKAGWAWVVEHCAVDQSTQKVTVIERWSLDAGYEDLRFP